MLSLLEGKGQTGTNALYEEGEFDVRRWGVVDVQLVQVFEK